MKKIDIRTGQTADIPEIHSLVGELAKYEKAPDEFVCTQQEYRLLFKENVWNFIVATFNGQIVGTCIYYYGFSTWKGKFLYLEDFIVTENYRRQGIGSRLFDHILQIAQKEECALMRWQVLDWNDMAINFYNTYNVNYDDGWVNCNILFD